MSDKIWLHYSDCAVHNEPAYPSGPCSCSRPTEIATCTSCGEHSPLAQRLTAELAAAQARAERAEAALRRSKRWLEGAEETFEASLDCGEDDHQATGECVRGDSYCERARDMRRGIAEIDAALAAAPEARDA